MSLDIVSALARRLHEQAGASRWGVGPESFTRALAASATHSFGDRRPDERELARYLTSLHLEDLALACACADGHEAAWEHFILTLQPVLRRTADALDPTGCARDLADQIYADLYGMKREAGERRSLLRAFHGRSSLATWLRSVLAQRHVDRYRATRRDRPLPEDDEPAAVPATARGEAPERRRFILLMRDALGRAMAALAARERLRLRCYYAEGLTLAETGRITGEHEATVSRQLARSRRAIREAVERFLAGEARLDEAAIAECFASATADAGPLDLAELLADGADSKKPPFDRSEEEPTP